MQRVLILGPGGAGKSTLARQLGDLWRLPVIHLDVEYWQPGWVEPEPEVWQEKVNTLIRQDRWIMDGNFGATLEVRVRAADTVIVLALPRLLCLYRIMKRVLRYKGRARPDMNPGCPEPWPDRDFLRWIWTYTRKRLPGVLEMLSRYEREKDVIILRTSRDVRRFLIRKSH